MFVRITLEIRQEVIAMRLPIDRLARRLPLVLLLVAAALLLVGAPRGAGTRHNPGTC
jgi:hypothetical protein